MFVRISCLSICSVACVFGLAGCDQDEIRTYQAPKDPSLLSEVQTIASSSAAKRPTMDWTVPDGWRRQSGLRAMRVATFEVDSKDKIVEIAVSAFPDRAGGLLANVNRWRGQVNLNPINQLDLDRVLVPFSNQSVRGYTLDFTGPESDGGDRLGERILGAIIDDGVGMTWFVKAKDKSSVLESLKNDVDQFARSFRITAANQPGHNHPPVTSDRSESKQDGWHLPQHWQLDTKPSTILSAAYNIHTSKGHARATVTVLVGGGGGLLANVNRWRHQLGLPPVGTLDQQPTMPIGTQSGHQPVTAFDLLAQAVGPKGRLRFLIAVLPHQNKTWYVKLTGPDMAVELEKQSFEKWVASIQSGHIHP